MESIVGNIVYGYIIFCLNQQYIGFTRDKIHPKNYGSGTDFVVVRFRRIVSISFGIISLELGKHMDLSNGSEAALTNMDKRKTWICKNTWYHNNKTTPNNTVCILYGVLYVDIMYTPVKK